MSCRRLPADLLLAAALLLPACRSAGAPTTSSAREAPPVRPAEFGSMHNVSVSGSAWIGSRPGVRDIDLAARRGVVAAIDLAGSRSAASRDLASACARCGIEYVPIELGAEDKSHAEIADSEVDRVLDELRRHAGKPLLLFCTHGDRATMLFAIHRVVDEDVPLEQALLDARRAGMKAGRPEAFVREQAARSRAQDPDASASMPATIARH
jgi:protein tyrosine phosphatase (PTP) superfamily phosphohydrolase (DUF442 family)